MKVGIGGGIAAAFIHPKSRKTIIYNYKRALIKIAKPGVSEESRAQLRTIFNFGSKAEEEEVVTALRDIVQKERLEKNQVFPPNVSERQIKQVVLEIERRRFLFAAELLKSVKESERTDRIKKIDAFFRANREMIRVPSEKEIRDIVKDGAEYTFE